jgi:TPR repeat protein
MSDNPERSIIAWPSHELIAALTGRSRILREIVRSSLALAKQVAPSDLDALVSEGKRIQRRKGMTPEDIQAFKLFYQAATGGHSEAQWLVAECYRRGHGVPQGWTKAAGWYQRAAEQGDEIAQNYLAHCYS